MVSDAEAASFAEEHGWQYFAVSAKSGFHVRDAFYLKPGEKGDLRSAARAMTARSGLGALIPSSSHLDDHAFAPCTTRSTASARASSIALASADAPTSPMPHCDASTSVNAKLPSPPRRDCRGGVERRQLKLKGAEGGY